MKFALCFILVMLAPLVAAGEESIFDPENSEETIVDEENAEETIVDEENAEETIVDEENAEETIVDEENAEDPDGESIFDSENEESIEDPDNTSNVTSTPDQKPSNAYFIGSYRTQSMLDLSFDGNGEDIFEELTDFNLRLEYEANNSLSVVLEAEFRHWWAFKEGYEDRRASYDARLGEAYIHYQTGRWSFRAGNLITRWGSTDLARPGDVVNPVDITNITPTGNLEKVPQLMLDVSYAGDWWGAQLLVIPFFVPNRVWAFGRDTSVFSPLNPLILDTYPVVPLLSAAIDPSIQDDIQPLLQATRVPEETLDNMSFGGRVTAVVANTDLGLGYLFGWDRTSFFHFDEDLVSLLQILEQDEQFMDDLDFVEFIQRNPDAVDLLGNIRTSLAEGDELFYSEYRRRQTIEIDLARYFGPIGVRAESAFQPAATMMDSNLNSIRRPLISSAFGLSWENIKSEDDALLLTLEGFYNQPLSRTSAITKAFVAEDERGESDEFFLIGTRAYGLQAAVSWMIPKVSVQVSAGGVQYISTSDYVVGGTISKRWYTWLQTGVSMMFFESYGQDDEISIGTLYDHNDYIGLDVNGFF